MKALTLWQPWATLVITGAKPFEFRSWRPPASIVGQRIVIHAAARKVDRREVDQLRRLVEAGGRYAAATVLEPIEVALAQLRADDWPLAAGLGSVIVGEAVSGRAIAAARQVERANDSGRDEHTNWGWPMLDIERWDDPIPMRGAQGLWTWPTPQGMDL